MWGPFLVSSTHGKPHSRTFQYLLCLLKTILLLRHLIISINRLRFTWNLYGSSLLLWPTSSHLNSPILCCSVWIPIERYPRTFSFDDYILGFLPYGPVRNARPWRFPLLILFSHLRHFGRKMTNSIFSSVRWIIIHRSLWCPSSLLTTATTRLQCFLSVFRTKEINWRFVLQILLIELEILTLL